MVGEQTICKVPKFAGGDVGSDPSFYEAILEDERESFVISSLYTSAFPFLSSHHDKQRNSTAPLARSWLWSYCRPRRFLCHRCHWIVPIFEKVWWVVTIIKRVCSCFTIVGSWPNGQWRGKRMVLVSTGDRVVTICL